MVRDCPCGDIDLFCSTYHRFQDSCPADLIGDKNALVWRLPLDFNRPHIAQVDFHNTQADISGVAAHDRRIPVDVRFELSHWFLSGLVERPFERPIAKAQG